MDANQKAVLEPFLEHLKFFGYSVEFDDYGAKAFHTLKASFRVYTLAEGVILSAPFNIEQGIRNDMPGFMEFLNRVNAGTSLCKYFLSFDRLFVQACYVGDYERERFGRFYEGVIAGIQAPQLLFAAEFTKYFGAPTAPKNS